MARKNKGKISPSPHPPFSSSLPAPPHQGGYFLSVLNLIPATILTLVPVLSLEDREVLAYMITRSLDSPAKKLSSRTAVTGGDDGGSGGHSHCQWLFQCECFDCYTAYWLRWDSSPHRELIHQVVEAFEEHLAAGKQLKGNNRGKRRNRKMLTRPDPHLEVLSARELSPVGNAVVRTEEEPLTVAERIIDGGESQAAADETAAVAAVGTRNDRKGLVRKVLPDVVGLFNSRLWELWNPSM